MYCPPLTYLRRWERGHKLSWRHVRKMRLKFEFELDMPQFLILDGFRFHKDEAEIMFQIKNTRCTKII